MKNLTYSACLASLLLIAACADGNRNLPFPLAAPDAGWFVSENLAVIAGMAQQPTETVDTTVFVATSITDTVLELPFAT